MSFQRIPPSGRHAILPFLFLASASLMLLPGAEPARPRTFANPLNLDYRFMVDQPSRREAADPAIVLFGDDYYLFASKSGGYWHSKDLLDWTFVVSSDLPIEAYAPAVMVYNNTLYYTACNIGLYKTTDPKSGKWEFVSQTFNVGDPDLFADDDGRVYLYYGLSYNGAISGMELDAKNQFKPIGEPWVCFRANYAQHGWERRGDDNLGAATGNLFQEGPWLEGSWMTKHNGTYYLQYASPGTEYRTYADGVYTASSPRGPFTYSPSSPFSFKPTGFITGAGHSGTFADKQGRYWHIATMVISMKHQFERRLGLFPVGFDTSGVLHMNTLFGDYPQAAPHDRKGDSLDTFAGWMLLSFGKKAQASSSIETLGPEKAFDEDIKTYWSARTANAGEWLSVDLGKTCRLEAIQVNFAEHESTTLGRTAGLHHQYRLESSLDGKTWQLLADRSSNLKDVPHDYLQLPTPATARYVRLTNVQMPAGGPFSVRDLRLFGSGEGKPPAAAPAFEVHRDSSDPRNAVIRWTMSRDTEGYIVRYGIAPGQLYHSYEVRGQKELSVHGLNRETDYYFTVDAFNDSGWTPGTQTLPSPAVSAR